MTKQKTAAKLKALKAELDRVVALNRRAVAAANATHVQAQTLQAQIAVVEELTGTKANG